MTIRLHLEKVEGKLRKKTGSQESRHLKIPGQLELDVMSHWALLWGCLSDAWFEHSFWKETVLCHVRFVTQLQIWKTSTKTSKASTMFLPRGCLSNTWFEYSFWEETVLCKVCNSASNLKDFYQISKEWTLIFSLSGYLCREETD